MYSQCNERLTILYILHNQKTVRVQLQFVRRAIHVIRVAKNMFGAAVHGASHILAVVTVEGSRSLVDNA